MSTYFRSVSRIMSDASQPPGWFQAITRDDTLYYASAGVAGRTGGTLAGPLPTHFGESDEFSSYGAGFDVLAGYASGTLLEEVGGPWGTMVYATGGHTRLQNQILGLNLNQDAPAWSWWQQPMFKKSATAGAELYYNPAEFDALPANRKILRTESTADWDGNFPVGFDGWIFPDKLVTGQMGDNAPHGFRYGSTCYVPSSVTGGDGLYLATLGPQGPFSQAWRPSGSLVSAWTKPEATFNKGQSRRFPYYFKNTVTGAWTEHKWQPDVELYGFVRQQCGVFRDLRRIYISGDQAGTTAGWWYIDMSNGFARMTRSEWVRPTNEIGPNRYACGAWTDGHPQGRHMVYFPDLQALDGLVVQDFDNNQQHRLPIGKGLAIPVHERIGMSYDSRHNRILIVLQDLSTYELYYYSIGIPSDPLDAGRYTVSRRTIGVSDPAMTSQLNDTTYFYRKTMLHPTLGVIIVPFARSRMLAFRPAP